MQGTSSQQLFDVFIQKAKRNMNKEHGKPPSTNQAKWKRKTVSIPYVKGVSETIITTRTFGRQNSYAYTTKEVEVNARCQRHTAADTVAGAVYAIGCGTCPKVYIGETV